MKTLTIGTSNEAKIGQIRAALVPLGLTIVGLPKDISLPAVVEDGKTAMENARKKALAYAAGLNQTVLSMDNALYFDGVISEHQPGLNVRRIPGHTERPSDVDLVEYYASLIAKLGGKIGGHWEFAICVAKADIIIGEILIKSPRLFVSEPCDKMILGYPLESLQTEPESGKYIADMSKAEQDAFWQKTIGKELCHFVESLSF